MSDTSTYVLGMAPEEIRRLAQQHGAWREQTERLWAAAGVEQGQTIVDIGCGPGFTTVDLARMVGPGGRVIGVEPSTAAAHELRAAVAREGLANVEVVEAFEADVNLAAYRPDIVFARWVYWFLPDAEASILRVAAQLEPGARFAVMDYCNYHGIGTEPASALFAKVFTAVHRSVAESGGSLDIAGRLPSLFRGAGLRTVRMLALSQVARPGEPVWQWVSEFQRLHLPALVEKGYLTPEELAEHQAWWSSLAGSPDSVFFAPPVMGVVGVKH